MPTSTNSQALERIETGQRQCVYVLKSKQATATITNNVQTDRQTDRQTDTFNHMGTHSGTVTHRLFVATLRYS